MNIGKEAELYVLNYFKKKRNIELISPQKGESGFDFRDKKSKIFVEVKGTSEEELSKVLFRYFTNGQYIKAKDCIKNNISYEIHMVLGIGESTMEHYIIPAKYFIDKAKPEVRWYLPTIQEMKKYKL